MGRFFINYPELINHDILDERDGWEDREIGQNFVTGVGDARKP